MRSIVSKHFRSKDSKGEFKTLKHFYADIWSPQCCLAYAAGHLNTLISGYMVEEMYKTVQVQRQSWSSVVSQSQFSVPGCCRGHQAKLLHGLSHDIIQFVKKIYIYLLDLQKMIWYISVLNLHKSMNVILLFEHPMIDGWSDWLSSCVHRKIYTHVCHWTLLICDRGLTGQVMNTQMRC